MRNYLFGIKDIIALLEAENGITIASAEPAYWLNDEISALSGVDSDGLVWYFVDFVIHSTAAYYR